MAAQNSPRKSPAAMTVTEHRGVNDASNSSSTARDASFALRKSGVSDPEEMLLLREKLNQIAVGLTFRRDAADHDDMDSVDDMDDDECERHQRRRRHGGGGHFKVFPLLGERPSTPPSSPQPRDVLRKQLRLRNSSFRLDDLPSHCNRYHRDDAGSHDLDAALDGVCVDAVEVTRVDAMPRASAQSPSAPPASVRLSIPGHLRVRSSSSFSVLTKNPEGLRKRKSDHVGDARPDDDAAAAAPLKKVSSEKNMLAPGGGAWDYDAFAASDAAASSSNQTAAPHTDHEMEDASPESPDSVTFPADRRTKRYS